MERTFEFKGIDQANGQEDILFACTFKNLPEDKQMIVEALFIQGLQNLAMDVLQQFFPEQYEQVIKTVNEKINEAIKYN